MAGTPLDIAQQRLNAYYAAETAILSGAQEYQLEGRKVRKADLIEIRAGIEALEQKVSDLQDAYQGGSRLYQGVPL